MQRTIFEELLESSKFDEATALLKKELAAGQLIDPRSDSHWPIFADVLARKIHEQSGIEEVVKFWENLLAFVIYDIEPKWGHAHKGHIYFRLGLTVLQSDLEKGKEHLQSAYEDDVILQAKPGQPNATTQSAYIVLAILEQIEDSEFSSTEDKQTFIKRLFKAFDTALAGAAVKPQLIEKALAIVAPPDGLSMCQSIYAELQHANSYLMPFALVSLTGTLIESLILADLFYRKKIRKVKKKNVEIDIQRAELGPLLEAASRNGLPPNSQVAFRLIHLFRNRVHPGNEIRQKYKLVPRVAMTIKVFCEFAILDWSKSFEGQQ